MENPCHKLVNGHEVGWESVGVQTKLSSNIHVNTLLSSFFQPFEDLRNYTMTLSALEKSKQWQWALELLSEMSHKSLKPDLTLDQTWCAALKAPCYPWFQWPPHLDHLILLLSLHFNETVFRKPKVGSPWNIGTQRCHCVFAFRPRANHFVGPFCVEGESPWIL